MSELFLYRGRSSVLPNKMKQTQELVKNGHVTSGGGRAKVYGESYASGTIKGDAYIGGTSSGSGSFTNTKYHSPAASSSSAAKAAGNTAKAAEKTEQALDWIERKLEHLSLQFDDLDKKLSNSFKSYKYRVDYTSAALGKLQEQIKANTDGATRYMEEAEKVGLSSDYMNKVKYGLIDIETITDETLAENIEKFQQWYDKARECEYAITDLKIQISELWQGKFDLLSEDWQNTLDLAGHKLSTLENQLDIIENRGHFAGRGYYEEMVNEQQKTVNQIEQQYRDLVDMRQQALKNGDIDASSAAAKEMQKEIDEVALSWQEAQNSLLEYKNDFMTMDTEANEWANEQLNRINDEAEFIRSLMSLNENDYFNKDTGILTDQGRAAGALHAMDYNVYMAQADEYRKKVEELNAALTDEPTNKLLIDQRNEYLDKQREAIENAQEEKKNVHDLIENEYNRMLECLDKIIDKRREQLQTEKNLYDYERNISESTDTIAKLRKQLIALQNDDSEESKAKRQSLSDQLKDAERNLQDQEYNQYIEDQEKLLTEMREEYERVLMDRLDDFDALMREQIDYANENANKVGATITEATNSVGYTLSEEMNKLWNSTDSQFMNVLTSYTTDFAAQSTMANRYVKGIFDILKDVTESKVEVDVPTAQKPSNSGGNSKPNSSSNSKPNNSTSSSNSSNSNGNSSAKKSPVKGGKINAGSAPIYAGCRGEVGAYGTKQYFASDPIYIIEDIVGDYLKVRWHKSSAGQIAGWFKKSDVTAMNTGGYTGNSEGLAILHKKERVLSAEQTKAFEKLVDNILPYAALNSNKTFNALNGGKTTNINSQIELNFNLPNVQNANDFVNELKTNKQFEDLVQHITFNKMEGKSSLRKNFVRRGR